MNILGLNGTSILPLIDARIDKHFSRGVFPYRWNWRYKHVDDVIEAYHLAHPRQPYVGIGFSSGGTIMHEIAVRDPFCRGIIVHSGLFRPSKQTRDIPVLLLRTHGDVFNDCFTDTAIARDHYVKRGLSDVTMASLEKTRWFGHEFTNGLLAMQDWYEARFDEVLPIHWSPDAMRRAMAMQTPCPM